MGRRCCIAGCPSTSRLPEHHGVTYHSYPLDSSIRAIWLRNTRVSSGRQITKSVLVCSRHFRRADFQPQRSGKYLLKHGVFPTVFPWGKVDPTQVEEDLQQLKASGEGGATTAACVSETEDATKATVEATVAQIMAQTAELNAAAGIKNKISDGGDTVEGRGATPPMSVKFEPVTSFNPGVRLEAQDFEGMWHCARVVEVDNDDREVLIKFERSGKNKSNVVGTEEWIPMNSTRLRQKVSTRPVPVFELEEKCMARWSGPRKFPGTVKKLLGNDTYEVLFDDGYVKNVRGVHMNKVMTINSDVIDTGASTSSGQIGGASSAVSVSSKLQGGQDANGKKRSAQGQRKDWPLLDLSKLDLASLNLPDIPKDGEWTCHWVNDQPIGTEGYLIVGEHRKPTVIVEDWRLPPGWVKHMYQRSNVLGKWDVILVTPNKKRFRSKADLKVYLEEQGQVYNPDIYDFSIHRRRAKDINAYVYTPDYVPQQVPKPKSAFNTTLIPELPSVDSAAAAAALASLAAGGNTEFKFIETPVATPVPPMELMTSTTPTSNIELTKHDTRSSTPAMATGDNTASPYEDGFAFIGGLKVQIVDNLFRCPQEGCTKNFRKENHLQIHVKHYHQDLNKLLGACPKMQELAEKRTHTNTPDLNEPQSKSAHSTQSVAGKFHQQDAQQIRTNRKAQTNVESLAADVKGDTADEGESLNVTASTNDTSALDSTTNNSIMDHMTAVTDDSHTTDLGIPSKRARFSPSKRTFGSRKSSRQRTTRRYLTAAQAVAGAPTTISAHSVNPDNSFGASDFEETRHSFNATPEATKALNDPKKRKTTIAPAMSISSLDSPVTADSGSSSFLPLHAPSSNEPDAVQQPQYIKENGEIIKIVRMRQEEIINCMCSYGEEDGLMIQCELCLCWQHGVCNGIDKESDVPDKYVCFICRNPQRARLSTRFKHDQDWLYEGKLPVANYHISNPDLPVRFEFLKKSHTLTGNLIELKQFMHSLQVKINIANNRLHPKLYLWAKKWDEDISHQMKSELKREDTDVDMKSVDKKVKIQEPPAPNIPQPEAAIEPVECQQRLMEHIKVQQYLVMSRLADIENEIYDLENQDNLLDLKYADFGTTKDVLATYIKELEVLKTIGKLNALENSKKATKNQINPAK